MCFTGCYERLVHSNVFHWMLGKNGSFECVSLAVRKGWFILMCFTGCYERLVHSNVFHWMLGRDGSL